MFKVPIPGMLDEDDGGPIEDGKKALTKNGTAKSVLSIGILGGAIIGLRELTFGGEPVLTQF